MSAASNSAKRVVRLHSKNQLKNFRGVFDREAKQARLYERQSRTKYFRRKHHIQMSSSWPSAYTPAQYAKPTEECLSTFIKYEGDMVMEDLALRKFMIALMPRSVGFMRLVLDDPIIHRTANQIDITVTLNEI